jgi:hypothetical protein
MDRTTPRIPISTCQGKLLEFARTENPDQTGEHNGNDVDVLTV